MWRVVQWNGLNFGWTNSFNNSFNWHKTSEILDWPRSLRLLVPHDLSEGLESSSFTSTYLICLSSPPMWECDCYVSWIPQYRQSRFAWCCHFSASDKVPRCHAISISIGEEPPTGLSRDAWLGTWRLRILLKDMFDLFLALKHMFVAAQNITIK